MAAWPALTGTWPRDIPSRRRPGAVALLAAAGKVKRSHPARTASTWPYPAEKIWHPDNP